MPKPNSAIALCGTEQPDLIGRLLHAGPVTVEFSDGQLRYLRLGGVEILRGLAFLVRNENWGTYVPEIADLSIRQDADSFQVTYRATCRQDDQHLEFAVSITGSSDGRLSFEGTAHAITDFLTARTGFVVLHPLTGTVGRPVELEHVDGTRESATFPELVDPVQPFLNLRAMTHEVIPGVTATVRMEGDTFETEDHRNWTDASFKTYVRPLAKPWPYVIEAGVSVHQSVTVTLSGRAKKASRPGTNKSIQVTLGKTGVATLPDIGLGVPASEIASTLAAIDLVRHAAPRLLIGHIDPRDGDILPALRGYAALSTQTAVPMMLEVVVTSLDGFAAEFETIARDVASAGLQPESVAVVPVGDLKSVLPGGERPPAPALEALYAAARKAFPTVKVGGGMFSFFTELNRKRVPAHLLDFVTHTTCPTVHAADDRSVMETLEALPHQVRTARTFIGATPYRVGPSAIGCRDNPHGATYTPNPDNGRICLPLIDPRMRALFGAAWVAAYLATLARTGIDAVSIGATTGPLGIIHRRSDYQQPFFDDNSSALVYPSFHVISGLARASGSAIVTSTSSDTARIQTLAYRQGGGTLLWLINLTAFVQEVSTSGLGAGAIQFGMLDEKSFLKAVTDPLGFQADRKPFTNSTIELPPYAVMFIGLAR